VAILNYGYAAAVHSCSANSNLVLRFGGTRDNYQHMIAHYPSIWRYAKRAGLRTIYVDAQSTGGRLQNLMTAEERADIDEFIQFERVPVLERDMAAADLLAARMNDDRQDFIYLNKVGAHFPIHDKYPESLHLYRPALERGRHRTISWTSDRTGFEGRADEWVRYRNSYRNTLLWKVGAFFKRLFAQTDFSGATVIYTSDHGQDLHELGNPGNNTHCGVNRPLDQEGLVPLIVFDRAEQPVLDWRRHFAANRNGMSHFRIFPTLLELMGYDPAGVRPLYGPPLTIRKKTIFRSMSSSTDDWAVSRSGKRSTGRESRHHRQATSAPKPVAIPFRRV
jgi:glucan phosphoethanolaminetransferase (alkaline phosphatase superfamily)